MVMTVDDLTDSLSNQSMRYGTVRLSVPPGFQNIIRLISHEVLREQPKDNIKFIADFLQDVLKIRDSTGYDPVLQGDLIERVQAQYSQLRKDRAALAEQKAKRPVPEQEGGGRPGGEAGGDTGGPATKKLATEEPPAAPESDVIEKVAESANEVAEEAKEVEPEQTPVTTAPEEAQAAPEADEGVPLEAEAALPDTEEVPSESDAVPEESQPTPQETEEVPPETTQEGAASTQEPTEPAPEPTEPAQEPPITHEEPSVATEEHSEST
ncbi:predicted GPI-anchored protein 58 [Lytechinus variegatus]|uniref:predicted GPI-anchored protein 58 n=1 Tax=Lytechinus variegatus TaxID=7654 RepID=UPI001BB2353F|nr:predicted GPI-anchored protein 58 [Lytechinus variegatus]